MVREVTVRLIGSASHVYDKSSSSLIEVPAFSGIEGYDHGSKLVMETKIDCNSSCGKDKKLVIENAEIWIDRFPLSVDSGTTGRCATGIKTGRIEFDADCVENAQGLTFG